jgi:hypothetical protein
MIESDIPSGYYGWWRIIETSQWGNDDIDIVGESLIPDPPSYRDKWRRSW